LTSRCLSLLAAAALGLYAGSAPAQQPAKPTSKPGSATVQQILDGKQLYINGKQAVVKQEAQVPEAIKTLQSRGQLSFSSGAVGRINRFSSMKLGSSCFLLEQGQILVSGPQNGCTRSSRLSVRGTNYVLEVDGAGRSQVSVLEGVVELQALRNGVPIATVVPTLVRAGEQLMLNPEGLRVALSTLKRSDYEALLRGPLFRGYQKASPYLPALIQYILRTYPGLQVPPELLRQVVALTTVRPINAQPKPQAQPSAAAF